MTPAKAAAAAIERRWRSPAYLALMDAESALEGARRELAGALVTLDCEDERAHTTPGERRALARQELLRALRWLENAHDRLGSGMGRVLHPDDGGDAD